MIPPDSDRREFLDLVDRVERRLAGPLPGLGAQLAMAPRPRRARPPPGVDPANPLPAAVVALLFPAVAGEPTVDGPARSGEPCLLLTRRTDRVASHKGEVCLPGGAVDAGESILEAALREAHEEVGVARDELRVLGRLTPIYIPVSGFRVEPIVAAADRRPSFRLAAEEVHALIEVPLARLRDHSIRGERSITREGQPVVIPHFHIAGQHVWGATAMVLAELCAVLDEISSSSPQSPT